MSATNVGGEGPASEPASAQAFFDAPAPPTNLRATNGDGQATLTWDPSPTPDVWYWVYQRDATENEAWQQLPLPVAECCTLSALYLTNGHDYEFKVTSTNGSESLPSNVVQVKPMPPRPGAPTNLRLQPLDSGDIKLAWDAPGPDVYYRVYWRDVTAGETTFRRSEYPTDQTTATWGYLTHQHVYEFKVTAENLAGEGPASAPVQAKSEVALPKAPTNLEAKARGDLQISLTWDAPGPNMLYWVYWRDATDGQPFQRSQYPVDHDWVVWQYLTLGHTYEFKVSAVNAAGEGPTSATASAIAIGTAPAPPMDLRAFPGDGSVRLDWAPSSTNNVGYIIYYRNTTKKESWQPLPYPVDCCTITMLYLTNGDRYEFKVTASNGAGESQPSNVVASIPMPVPALPPTNLRATAGDGKVLLAWSASPTPRVYYWIEYRKSGSSDWIRLKYPLSDCCTFTVEYLANGTTYEFRVLATNLRGDSVPSNVDSARPMPPFPQAPSNLSATNAGDGKVKLTWSPSPTQNVYYFIEYRKVGGSWVRLPYPVTTCCSFTMKYLLNGTTYEFRVRATNLSGVSNPSNVDTARPMPPMPQAPSNLRAVAGPNQVTLSWSASPTPNVYYYIYQRDVTWGGSWQRLPYPISARSLTVGYLIGSHQYSFKVTAVNLTGESGPSNIVTVTPGWPDHSTPTYSITSSWHNYLNEHTQTYNVTGTVRGTRSGAYIRLDGSWHMNNGERLLSGIFVYNIIDCDDGGSVWYDTLEYPNGTWDGGGWITFSWRMTDPWRHYKVRVHGYGDITTDYSFMVYGRYSLYSPPGIKRFIAETPCF